MRDSFLILAFFVAGLLLARFDLVPAWLTEHDPTLPALWLLMALVGFSLGADRKTRETLRSVNPRVLLIPVAASAGSFAGALVASFFVVWNLADCLAVASGFAYYSLSSVFITKYKGSDLGSVALVANILRELATLLFTPFIVRFFGPASAIACGGASAMDTTLPIISRFSGASWVAPSIISAAILDISVPFWVTLFCSL